MQRRNSLYAFITAVGLVTWITAGSYLFSENCCGTGIDSYDGTIQSQMIIQDGGAFRLETKRSIIFPKNESKPILYKDVSLDLMKVVRYVKANPIKKVTIMGLFAGNESAGAQLGRDRADSIRQLFLNAGTPEYQVSVEAGRRDDLVQDRENGVVFGAIDFIFDCIAPFEVKDAFNGFKLEVENNIVFQHASAGLLLELPDDMDKALTELANYLNKQTTRKLVLTGYNHPDEDSDIAIDNLGLARANYVRNLLLQRGANGRQIEIKGIEDERLYIGASDLYQKFLPNAMGFQFAVLPLQAIKKLDRKGKKIEAEFKDMQVFRFKDFGEHKHKIIINDALKAYMNDLILYLSINEKAMVYCVGHSNHAKDKTASALKGTERAQYVRAFLMKHGLLGEQIKIATAGDTHPLGAETTRYGQQINRRVDLFLSYDGSEPKLYALPPLSKSKKTIKQKTTTDQKNSMVDSIAREKQPSTVEDTKVDSL